MTCNPLDRRAAGRRGQQHPIRFGRLSILAALLPAVLLGCASTTPKQSETDAAPVSKVDQRINKSAENVERLLTELVMLERSRAGGAEFKSPSEVLPADDPLQKRASLVWKGDVRIVVQRLAGLAGLGFAVVGKSPTTLVAQVEARDRPLANILESVGTQIGENADLVYRRSEGVIELRFR